MGRRSGFGKGLGQLARAIDKAHQAHQRAELHAQKIEKLHTKFELQKEASEKSGELKAWQTEIDNILEHTLSVDDFYDLNCLRRSIEHPDFESLFLIPEPEPDEIREPARPVLNVPRPPGFLSRIFGGTKRYEVRCKEAEEQLKKDLKIWESEVAAIPARRAQTESEWAERERIRQECLASDKTEHERECRERANEIQQANQELDDTIKGLAEGSAEAVEAYLRLVLEKSSYPEGLHPHFWLCFEEDSSTLKMIGEIVPPSVLPCIKEFKYVGSADEIVGKSKSEKELKTQYETFLANIALRTIHEVFEADRGQVVKSIDITLTTHHEQSSSCPGQQRVALLSTQVERQEFLMTPLTAQAPVQRVKVYDTLLSKNAFLLFPISEEERRKRQEKLRIAEEQTAREAYIASRQGEAQSKTEALWAQQREIRQILSVGMVSKFDFDKLRMSESPPTIKESRAAERGERGSISGAVCSDNELQSKVLEESPKFCVASFQYSLQAQRHNAEIESILAGFHKADRPGVCSYFNKVLQHSQYPHGFKPEIDLDFDSLSRELAVTVQVLGPQDMPAISEYVYIRTSDSIVGKKLPRTALKELYENYIGAVTIRTAFEIWSANQAEIVRSVSMRITAGEVVPGTNRKSLVSIVEWAPTWTEVQAIAADGLEAIQLLGYSSAVVSKNLLNLSPIPAGRNIGRVADV
jgi:restriction system protein